MRSLGEMYIDDTLESTLLILRSKCWTKKGRTCRRSDLITLWTNGLRVRPVLSRQAWGSQYTKDIKRRTHVASCS